MVRNRPRQCPVGDPERAHEDREGASRSSILGRTAGHRGNGCEQTIGLRVSLPTRDETSFPREVCEGVLAHIVGGVEGAYRRSDALEKRRALLAAWANYIEGRTEMGNVVPIAVVAR